MVVLNNLISFIENKDIGQYKENYSFKKLTSYRTGGDARLVLYPKDVSSLGLVQHVSQQGKHHPFLERNTKQRCGLEE